MPARVTPRRAPVAGPGYPRRVTEELALTTDPVELPGVAPADPPTELVPGRLWQAGIPVDYDWARGAGITAVVDLADPDTYPPAGATEGLLYMKSPLVDGADVPDPAFTLRMASLVAGLATDGYQVLVHCTFGRNRSGLMASLVVRELLGLSGEDAMHYVQQRREGTVNNESFATWLRTLPAPDRPAD